MEKVTNLFHPVPPVIPPVAAVNSEPVPAGAPFAGTYGAMKSRRTPIAPDRRERAGSGWHGEFTGKESPMSHANRKKLRVSAAAAGALAVAGGTLAASWAAVAQAAPAKPAAAHMAGMPAAGQAAYRFTTLDNASDVTFNQLLAINGKGLIAGYFGSGAAGHPSKGYLLNPPYGQGNYASENFPGSAQTQVTGLNDRGVTVGFWSGMNNATMVNDNHGFWARNGVFHNADFPAGKPATPPADQLLGVNDGDVAVGFYTDAQGNDHGYAYSIETGRYSTVTDPHAPAASLTAAAINNHGDVAGFYANPATGNTDGFLKRGGRFTDLAFPGASSTMALGVNDHDEVVGVATIGSGSNAVMHGFTWMPGHGFTVVDDPGGAGTTTINGLNNTGDLVGFYVDGQGNTDGFLATPLRETTIRLSLSAMPQGTVSAGDNAVVVTAWGLTPGSAHTVLLHGDSIGTLAADGTGQASATFAVRSVPGGGRVKILDGGQGTDVIAQTDPLGHGGRYRLHALEAGFGQGSLSGHATLVYDPAAQTITVTLSAAGVSPGAHAAHIHVGSCQSQGAVAYMLPDFTADGHGVINNETRTVTGVTAPMLNGGWYLNLHQGNSNDILANGQPTINFRPLLCASI